MFFKELTNKGEEMELTVSKREEKIKKLRRENKIPCVLYSPGKESESVSIEKAQFEAITRKLKEGEILTTIFELKEGKKTVKAIIKEIQYHRTTYNILHIDFLRLEDKTPVKLRIPIRFEGSEECKGVKEGGVLKQAIPSASTNAYSKSAIVFCL